MQADSLREKIACEIDAASDDPMGHWSLWLPAADRILAIPEIAEALTCAKALKTGEGLTMTLEPPILAPPSDSLSGSDRS